MVNATSENDWTEVREIAARFPDIVTASYGLHPWKTTSASKNWITKLENELLANPHAHIGECGLDKWIQGHDLDLQKSLFTQQLSLAQKHQRVATIHCLKAWGSLREILSEYELPKGFLLHSYAGPRDWIPWFVEKGAYFSCSGYFFHDRKQASLNAFHDVPKDRLLLETDAPDMLLPQSMRPGSETANHPQNLRTIYEVATDIFKVTDEQLLRNYTTLFLE